MEDWSKRIEAKLDKVENHIGLQAVSIERLTVSVEDHVRRSNLQDENLVILRRELEPLKRNSNMLEGVVKLLATLGVIAGIAASLFGILHVLR